MTTTKVLELQAGHAANLAEGLVADLRKAGVPDCSVAATNCQTAANLLRSTHAIMVREAEEQATKARLQLIREGRLLAEPQCGHSACRQHWIETGEGHCVEGSVESAKEHRWTGDTCADCGALRNGALSPLRCGILTLGDRAQGEEAMARG